jgi:uncharacterized membrane protein
MPVWVWLLFVLHLLGAAFWVGGMGFALLALRPALPLLEPAQRVAFHAAVMRRFLLVVWHAAPLMILTGFPIAHYSYGGMAGWPPELLAMMTLGLVMFAIFLGIFFGPWAEVRRALAAGETAAAAAGFAQMRRLITLNFCLGLLTVAVAGYES